MGDGRRAPNDSLESTIASSSLGSVIALTVITENGFRAPAFAGQIRWLLVIFNTLKNRLNSYWQKSSQKIEPVSIAAVFLLGGTELKITLPQTRDFLSRFQ